MTKFLVVDKLLIMCIQNIINIDIDDHSHHPVSFWFQHYIPCRYMHMGISTHAATLVGEDRDIFLKTSSIPRLL